MTEVLGLLFDKEFLVTALVGIFAFATIITLVVPMLERDVLGTRMKNVSQRREELRNRQREAMSKRATLRTTPTGFMKRTVDRFKLVNLLESEDSKDKLSRAGLRGQSPMIAFMFFRFIMPGIVFLVTLFYLFVVLDISWAPMVKVCAAFAGALIGYYLPDLYVSNRAAKRQQSIMRAFPDALDLMLICVESGMSIEHAFTKVSAEIGAQSPELAEELGLTTAELSYLTERRQAFDNLSKRTGHPGVKAVAGALNQAEHYGTPLGQALRVAAQENREGRMAEAEKKAAALPAKLTVPMILFFLPVLFVVIMGPAFLGMMGGE